MHRILFMVADKIPAPLPGFNIPFFIQKGIGMFHRNDTDSGIIGHNPLGWQFVSQFVHPVNNIIPNQCIKLHIRRTGRLVIEFVFHLVISSLLILVIYVCSVIIYNKYRLIILQPWMIPASPLLCFFFLKYTGETQLSSIGTQPVLLLRKPVFSQSLQGFCIVVSGECRYE